MSRRVVDGFLLVLVLIGGTLAWYTGRERGRLTRHYERLVRMVGDLPIKDASKVHVLALDTGDPQHFAWRVYLPPPYNLTFNDRSGSLWTTSIGSPESIFRVRIRQDAQGDMELYEQFGGMSTERSFGTEELVELLRGRWDKVKVEQLGAPEVAVLDPDQPAALLRLTLADDLLDEARKKLTPEAQKEHIPVLFDLNLGPPVSKP
jgi:hypothetical protein